MIPQDKTAAVTRALREAFGVAELEDIRPLSTGPFSNLVCRIVVRGEPFLLRIVTRPMSIGSEREFTCMKIAAEAGPRRRVWTRNVEARISITAFVHPAAFPATEAPVGMARTWRAVHALPPFPRGVD